ncbi:MAG TPA: CAP domain-containing protein [Polyangiaceae bacterium]|nr:CAP domain-containing protein [Polyangiaceae bacterium]
MQQARARLCALVGLALSIACSGTDEGPATGSGGNGSAGAGRPSAIGGDSSLSGGNPNGGSQLGNGGGASSGGDGSVAGGPNGGAITGGDPNNGGIGGAAISGSGSGGKSSGGTSAGGAGSGGKSSGGANGSGGNGACPEQTSQLCGMTAQHNQARANVNPVPATPLPIMSWDTKVAAAAQAWADQCNFSHYTAGYGQNLYASAGGGPPSPTAVVTSWVSEVAEYNYSSNACSGTCGHYTQVVWRSSILVGCGYKACSTNTPFGAQFPNWHNVVCNYSPPGNNGSRPY